MNLLAFDTSTDVLSVAVQAGDAVLAHSGEGGAKASAALIPAIRSLLAQAGLALGALDAIAFGCGPGSFTGLRTACSVAQGLALGADLPVLPVETLMVVAQAAHGRSGAGEVMAVLDARMGEVYAAPYRRQGGGWLRTRAIWLGPPEQLQLGPGSVLAGNAFAAYGDRLPHAQRIEALPRAEGLLQLAPVLLQAGHARAADEALPLYVRDKVAQTTAEREAARSGAARQDRMTP